MDSCSREIACTMEFKRIYWKLRGGPKPLIGNIWGSPSSQTVEGTPTSHMLNPCVHYCCSFVWICRVTPLKSIKSSISCEPNDSRVVLNAKSPPLKYDLISPRLLIIARRRESCLSLLGPIIGLELYDGGGGRNQRFCSAKHSTSVVTCCRGESRPPRLPQPIKSRWWEY